MNIQKLIVLLIICSSAFYTHSQINQTDAKGMKQGVWEKKYPNSNAFEYKGQFKNNQPVGTFTYFYPSTKVKVVMKHDEKTKRSESYMYYETGNLMSFGIYINQKKDSVWTKFGPSKRISARETFKNDLLDGKSIVYYVPEDLNDKSTRIVKESTYKNGKLEGVVLEYFDSGVIKAKSNYLDGLRHGQFLTNYPNGKPMLEDFYKYNYKNGFSRAFDEEGREIGKKYYKMNNLLEGDELQKWIDECKKTGKKLNG
jgi:antitoxin component YwqK of YwqJK toxin-antitoxin module